MMLVVINMQSKLDDLIGSLTQHNA